MRCHRCGEMMIYEKFYDHCEHFFEWKCISCGEILDRVILDNRRGPRGPWSESLKGRLPNERKDGHYFSSK